MTQNNLLGEKVPDYINLKAIVGTVLRDEPLARESDKHLIKKVLEVCQQKKLKEPSFETITRIRRKYNESGLYLPSKETQEKRRQNETFFRDAARKKIL
jgi:hypothetical protein